MPTPTMTGPASSGRQQITDATVSAYMRTWAPPDRVADLLSDRGTRDRVLAWLTRWARAMSQDTSNNSAVVGRAVRFAGVREPHTWTARYGSNAHTVRWLKAILANPTGGPEIFDLGQPDVLREAFAEAVRPGRGGITYGIAYSRPSNFGEAVEWADDKARIWYEGAIYIDTFASDTLRAMATWYAGQRERNAAAAAEARQQAADDAITREAERQAQAERERIASRPERIARMQQAAERLFQGQGRTAERLRAKLADLGPARARFALGLAADAEAAAEAAGATAEEAQAAGDAALEQAATLLDIVYPLEDPAYYVDTWGLLPGQWQALYLALAWADDPYAETLPVADPAFYVQTIGRIPTPWANLFYQSAYTAE